MGVVPNKTIDDYFRLADGKPFGFDNLRIILAFAVILWHTIVVCYGLSAQSWFWTGPLRPIVYFIVPGFFALSGFLVAGSLLRNDLLSFVSLRAIRIYPALALEVLISAFLIGPVLTTFSLHQYFTDKLFLKYLLNVFGWIHYYLPGLFLNNPGGPQVNTQLWTVPDELKCYVLLVILALFGLHRKPVVFFLSAIAITAATLLYIGLYGRLIAIDERPPDEMIILCFIFGAALFLLKSRIYINFWTFIASFAAYSALIYSRHGIYLAPFFAAYATVYLGILNVRLPLVRILANYSYGVYLYGFPIQQVVSLLLPDHRIWWINFILSATVTLGIAAFSWHLIEKPINDNKKAIIKRIAGLRRGGGVRLLSTKPDERGA